MQSHSQCQEDLWILENLVPKMPAAWPRTFCEVGAYDGILSSNTKLFEDLGWTGILIEADPVLLAKARENRPKAKTLCCAVANVKWQVGDFYLYDEDRGLSGLEAPGHDVLTVLGPLADILRKTKLTDVSLVSIDTEGTELDVWQSMADIFPPIVIMEYQTCQNPPRDKEICAALTAVKYRLVHQTQYNLIFTNQ